MLTDEFILEMAKVEVAETVSSPDNCKKSSGNAV